MPSEIWAMRTQKLYVGVGFYPVYNIYNFTFSFAFHFYKLNAKPVLQRFLLHCTRSIPCPCTEHPRPLLASSTMRPLSMLLLNFMAKSAGIPILTIATLETKAYSARAWSEATTVATVLGVGKFAAIPVLTIHAATQSILHEGVHPRHHCASCWIRTFAVAEATWIPTITFAALPQSKLHEIGWTHIHVRRRSHYCHCRATIFRMRVATTVANCIPHAAMKNILHDHGHHWVEPAEMIEVPAPPKPLPLPKALVPSTKPPEFWSIGGANCL